MVIQRKTVFASNEIRSAFVNARKRKKKIPDEIIGGAVAYKTPSPICLKPLFQNEASTKLLIWNWFFILMEMKLIFPTKVLHSVNLGTVQ